MKPHILRVHERSGRWVISDGRDTLRGGTSASLCSVVARWEAIHGRPPTGYTRVVGHNRPAQAAAFLANLARQLPKSCRACGCTDDDCRQCVEASGHACGWVAGEEPPLCSRCDAEHRASAKASVDRLRSRLPAGQTVFTEGGVA